LRKFIYLSSAVLFLLTGIGLIVIGIGEKDSMMIGLFAASIPFIYTAYWNFFSYHIENQTGSNGEYFTYNNAGSRGIGISYNKTTVVPFFLVLFTSVSLAIATFFLAVNRSTEDIAIGSLCLSFLASTIITIYFTKRINKALNKSNLNGNIESKVNVENVNDDIGFKIAFFFASVATLGLFPLVYFIIKKVRSGN
jgi:hypothetical protein